MDIAGKFSILSFYFLTSVHKFFSDDELCGSA